MNLHICNPHKTVSFFNRNTNVIQSDIWNLLTLDQLRKASLLAHEQNSLNLIPRPDKYKEVIQGIVPLPPRSSWVYDGNIFSLKSLLEIKNQRIYDLSDLLRVAKRILKVVEKDGIAIELSGGLDTSIVIGLLDKLGSKPLLVGMTSNRYEFRTEAIIQEYYRKKIFNTHLFSMEEVLPFTDLINTPIHQLPSTTSLFHAHAKPIIKLCQERGIKTILTGMGLDALLCDSPYMDGGQFIPQSWLCWMHDDDWLNEYVYRIFGLTCKSAASSNTIICAIWSMRQGQGEDLKKWWARQTFSDLLPPELVHYAYKANFNGNFIDGLLKAKEEIRLIFKATYDITRLNEFSPQSLDTLICDVHKANDSKDQLIFARISFANWIYSHAREKM